jgi:hypothetical protein
VIKLITTTTFAVPVSLSMRLLERDLLPDFLVRFGIRRLLKARLVEEDRGGPEAQQQHLMKLISRPSDRDRTDSGGNLRRD